MGLKIDGIRVDAARKLYAQLDVVLAPLKVFWDQLDRTQRWRVKSELISAMRGLGETGDLNVPDVIDNAMRAALTSSWGEQALEEALGRQER